MPCSDGSDYVREVQVESGTQTQRLCAVFTVLERQRALDKVLDSVNWEEAGVTRASTEAWWQRHKREDLARRKREREARMKEAERLRVLRTLTPEQKKILGLK